MKHVSDTLFYPVRQGGIDDINTFDRIGCVNTLVPNDLSLPCTIYSDLKLNTDHVPFDTIAQHPHDLILVAIPKNAIAAQYIIARSVKSLNENGILICAAENNANGKRLKKWFKSVGLSNIQTASKNKHHIVWGYSQESTLSFSHIDHLIKNGISHHNNAIGFATQPGVYGWNKIDAGSQHLAHHLNAQTLKGTGADFGCGYGYLSKSILDNTNNTIDTLFCIDNDARAIHAAQVNLKDHNNVNYMWEDITNVSLPPLNFIVMNPPFHTNKHTDTELGKAFIRLAQKSLKTAGVLHMVANAHLPYEDTLKAFFHSVDTVFSSDGFKGFRAVS